MFQKTKIAVALCMSLLVAQPVFSQSRPFPQAGSFEMGGTVIKPTARTQDVMNSDVTTLYDKYKNKYLKSASNGKYYIDATGNGAGGASALTISEAHGYGMIIFALMAGYDSNAKTVFDGMNALRKAQQSTGNSNLMSWVVYDVNASSTKPDNSATDGDLDNAYALLLAYTQWGDSQYLTDAQKIITALKSSSMHQNTLRTALGDWDGSNSNTRSSDWMPGHFRAFYDATGDNFWLDVADNVYTMIGQCANSSTGLIPDFATGSPAYADATGGGTNESYAQYYYYNACRDPWRLALDYAHYGTVAAKTQIDRISTWLKNTTNSNTNNIMAGYYLTGSPIGNYNDLVFTAPFASGMIANSDNQEFLNSTYNSIRQENAQDEYAMAIQLLNMLLITGNWWAPYSDGNVEPCDDCDDVELDDLVMREWSDNGEGSKDCDGYGSWSEIDTNDTDNGILKFRMNVAAMYEEDEIYPWASIGTYFDAGDFPSEATKFEITYTSSAPIMLSFLEPEIAEGYVRGFELPVQTTEKTISVDISGFQYPDWGEEYPTPALDKSKISGVMIEAIPLEGQTHTVAARFTALKIMSGATTSIQTPKTVKKVNNASVSISKGHLNFNIPSEKVLSVRICDIRGRLLFNKEVNLNSGVLSLALPKTLATNQMLVLNVKGQNGLNLSRKMLVK